jgi:hypothetical protein
MLSKLVKIVSLGSVIAGATIAPAAAQYRRQDYVVIWYTDENETTISGQRVVFCDGVSIRVGTPTLYEETIYYGCS